MIEGFVEKRNEQNTDLGNVCYSWDLNGRYDSRILYSGINFISKTLSKDVDEIRMKSFGDYDKIIEI